MRKLVSIVTIIAIISLMAATFVFAEENANVPQWFKDMISWRKAQVEQAEKNGDISEDQAELYREHIDQMAKFHEENGFPYIMGFRRPGGCGGNFYNNNINAGNTGYGFGRGMMGSYPIQ